MKRLLPLLAALLLVSGCKKDNIVILTPVHVSLGDFEVINDDQTTAKDEPLATYSGVKAVTLAFYSSTGSLAYSSTQLRADSTSYAIFGEFDLALAMDSYTMEVFAYGSEQPLTLNGMAEASYTADKVRETFVAAQTVNIANTSPVNVSAHSAASTAGFGLYPPTCSPPPSTRCASPTLPVARASTPSPASPRSTAASSTASSLPLAKISTLTRTATSS